MRRGGYDSYRGRSRFRTFLKVLIVLPERTYATDCIVEQYDEKDQMELVL